jgi:hypothetical protein
MMVGVLSEGERAAFAATGVVRLDGAFSRDAAAAMEAALWRFAEQRGMQRGDPSTWLPGQLSGASPKLKRRPAFDAVWSEPVRQAVDQLLDGEATGTSRCGMILTTFPNASVWEVPHAVWHLDTHLAHPPEPLFGVKTYGFINEVGPGGGGTCVLAGVHHLVARFQAAHPPSEYDYTGTTMLQRFLRSHPWLQALSRPGGEDRHRFLEPTEIDGVEVQVVELTGQPGDVVLTHPWALHTIACNASTQPRFMTSNNVFRVGAPPVLRSPG